MTSMPSRGMSRSRQAVTLGFRELRFETPNAELVRAYRAYMASALPLVPNWMNFGTSLVSAGETAL